MRLPIVKRIIPGKELSHLQIESFQKYWGLWMFAGGDEQTYSAYMKDEKPPKSERTISFQRFGLLLTWFGHFGKFLNELVNAMQLKVFYDDQMSGQLACNLILGKLSDKQYNPNELFLIRCASYRDYPFAISHYSPQQEKKVLHYRIKFNPATRQYYFQHPVTKATTHRESITDLFFFIIKEMKFGESVVNNVKFENINNPYAERRDSYTPNW